MKFEFTVNDLQSFLEKKGYDWNKKTLINNKYILTTKEIINSRNFVNGYLKIKITQGTKKLNLELDINPTKLVVISCDEPWLGKFYSFPKSFSNDWCKHMFLTYGEKYVNFFKNYNESFLKQVTKLYKTEKQKIDEHLKELNDRTKLNLEKYKRNQELLNEFLCTDKTM